MDAQRREVAGGWVAITGGFVEAVGASADPEPAATRVIDATDCLVTPGLINTHHHIFQNLTRAYPPMTDKPLFGWLQSLYPLWKAIDEEAVFASTWIGLAELALSGCTTSSDHHYLWPNGCRLDDQFEAATSVGVRFHGTRGSMSLGESQGGLPPDRAVERENDILADSRRVVETFHDPSRHAMRRVALAPCSPFSVTTDLMRESARLARSFHAGVRLHTHLAETQDENDFCLARFGARPADYADQVEWLGSDVWHAHCVHLNDHEVATFGRTATGVAHCPTSNMRLASGIAPIKAMRRAGVPVGLGVDGSASNDGSHLLAEARQAMLLQRVLGDPAAMTARAALETATLGGARVLGRDDIGALAPGMAADIIAFDLNVPAYAGAAVHDPVAALIFCQPQALDLAVVHGRVLVEDGHLRHLDLPELVHRHNRAARGLLQRAGLA
jgi:cytosine/adenosine deaminase-related metal-dependent hydrolase